MTRLGRDRQPFPGQPRLSRRRRGGGFGRPRHGFTLLELLIAIGIILVLVTIGVLGYRSLEQTASERNTKLALNNGESLVKEMNAIGALQRLEGPRDSFPAALFVPTLDVPPMPPTFASPGKVTPDQGATRTALLEDNGNGPTNQHDVMRVLMTNPKNKTAIQGFPSQSILSKPGGVPYPLPILADGWGNPILFVPSGGLTGVKLEVRGGREDTITSTGLRRDPGRYPNANADPAGQNRAFWASAGPDGDFTTGDDNIYSFQAK